MSQRDVIDLVSSDNNSARRRVARAAAAKFINLTANSSNSNAPRAPARRRTPPRRAVVVNSSNSNNAPRAPARRRTPPRRAVVVNSSNSNAPPRQRRRRTVVMTSNNSNINSNAPRRRPGKEPMVSTSGGSSNLPGPSRRRPRGPIRGPGSTRAREFDPEVPSALRDARNAAVAAANARQLQTVFGGFQLRPYQANVSALFAKPRAKGLLLYYKVGSGKTITSIAAAENLARAEGVRRPVVVVTPASLIANYKKELAAALGAAAARRYTVVSFEYVHARDQATRANLGRGAVVIVDEVQNLRNPTSVRLRSMLELVRESHKRLLLSGTPVMNFPKDIGPVLALMNPAPEIVRRVAYRVKHPDPGAPPDQTSQYLPTFNRTFGATATRNVEELDGMLRCAVLFYEPDAATQRRDYPEKREHWVEVPLAGAQVRMQLALAGDAGVEMSADMEDYDESTSTQYLTKPREINTFFGSHYPKIGEVVNRVAAEWRRGGKCIVFSSFLKSALYRARGMLADAGVPCEVFEGKLGKAAKNQLVQAYNTDQVRVLLLSDAGKEGLDLKNTTQIHIIEPAWNEEKIQQVIGRGVRYKSHTGPNRAVDVYRYVAVFPPDWQRYLSFSMRRQLAAGNLYGLFTRSADEILRTITQRKAQVNAVFLHRLVRISQENLERCLR